jgi:hypothetical protein
MADFWVHNGTTWVQGVPSIMRPTGNVPGKAVFVRPTTSTWSLAWQRDETPPPAPIIASSIVTGTRNKLSITITTPDTSKKFLRVVVKVGINKWATSPTANDGTFYSETQAGEQWSEWFTASLVADNTIEPGEVATKQFPAAYQANINLPLNTAINISAWVQDTSLNWSPAATRTQYTRKSTDTPAGMSVFKTAIMPTTWDAWSNNKDDWLYRSKGVGWDHKWVLNPAFDRWHVFSGTFGDWRTYVCYGSRIRQVMNTAYEVRKVHMPLRRRSFQSGISPQEGGATDGPSSGSIIRVYPGVVQNIPAKASSAQWLVGEYADITMRDWSYGERQDMVLPKVFWEHFIDGKGDAFGFVFASTARTATTSNNDKYSVSFALTNDPGSSVSGYASKINKGSDGLDSGLVVVEWVGYSNPWPNATPGAENFKPMGWTAAW